MHNDYLERILTSRVYDVAIESPLERANNLSARMNNTLLLKREDMQPVFSFKLRGAYNKMALLKPAELARGVIAASAGNHAQGVALAAQKLKCRATIVMPVTTPQIKVTAVAARGAEVVLYGDSYDEAYQHSKALARKRGFEVILQPRDRILQLPERPSGIIERAVELRAAREHGDGERSDRALHLPNPSGPARGPCRPCRTRRGSARAPTPPPRRRRSRPD